MVVNGIEIKVGQRWKMRNGETATVASVNTIVDRPIRVDVARAFGTVMLLLFVDGRYQGDRAHDFDLIELLEDVPGISGEQITLQGVEPAGHTLAAPGYDTLADVLKRAFDQASAGKGKERHANDLPFHEQPMQQIARRRGIGFILGQADKKSEEAQGMLERGKIDACVRELLGAIVYTAGAIIRIEADAAKGGAE